MKGGNSDSFFKNETDDDEFLFNIYDKTNKHQIIYVMNLEKQQI